MPKDEWLQVSFDNVMHNSLSEGASVPLEDLKKEGNTYVRITCLVVGGGRVPVYRRPCPLRYVTPPAAKKAGVEREDHASGDTGGDDGARQVLQGHTHSAVPGEGHEATRHGWQTLPQGGELPGVATRR